MRTTGKVLMFTLVAALPLAAATIWSSRAPRTDALTIATWNLEWLVNPATSHAGRLACRQGRRSSLPCDVAENLARDSADIARLAGYARKLNADVIAFQEVEDEAIARRVFMGYSICMADGAGVQHVGFAVRTGVPHRCGPVVESLSLGGLTRNAMSLRLQPVGGIAVELLVVHLKSGCSRDPLDSGTAACRTLDQQAGRLGEWIAARTAEQADFLVLGDFNRETPRSEEDTFWTQVQTGPSELLAANLPFSNCFTGQPYSAYIDHMLLSSKLGYRVIPGSARHEGFRDDDALQYRLADHCPVRVSLILSRDIRAHDKLSSVAR